MKHILVITGILVLILRLEAQNVGIGIADPAHRIDVFASNSNATVGRFMSGGGFGEIQIGNSSKSLYLGTNTSGAYIASSNGDPLFFRIAGSIKMTLLPSGLFGIGTETPGYRLDVQSPGSSSTVSRFKTAGGVADIIIENGVQQLKIGVNDSTGYLRTATGHDLRLQTGGQDRIFIDHSSGHVGINTSTPQHKLDTYTGSINSTIARFRSVGGFGDVLVENGVQKVRIGVDTSGGYLRGVANDLRLQTGSVDRVVIDYTTGNIGMGTNDPLARLHISKSTTSPGSNDMLLLHNSNIGGAGIRFRNQASNDNPWQCYVHADATFRIGRGADFLQINTTGSAGWLGHLGLGTFSPGYRLDARLSGTNATVAQFKTTGGIADILVQNETQHLKVGVNDAGGYVRTATAHDLFLQTGSVTRITLDHGTGHVGIGTTEPTARLDVDGNIKVSGVIENEAVQTPTLLNGWTNYGLDGVNAGYYKDKEGVVHLRGVVKWGTENVIMILPENYRPVGTELFMMASESGSHRVNVTADGYVGVIGDPSVPNEFVSLSGIQFRTN